MKLTFWLGKSVPPKISFSEKIYGMKSKIFNFCELE